MLSSCTHLVCSKAPPPSHKQHRVVAAQHRVVAAQHKPMPAAFSLASASVCPADGTLAERQQIYKRRRDELGLTGELEGAPQAKLQKLADGATGPAAADPSGKVSSTAQQMMQSMGYQEGRCCVLSTDGNTELIQDGCLTQNPSRDTSLRGQHTAEHAL